MRGGGALLAGGLALVVFVGVAAAGTPLVSAGLDQNVVQGDPVYLDAGGTHVPDGELAGLEWSIEAPNGSTIDPNCVDCEVTWFRANQTGEYDVTLTATSESGKERSDTLYVTVEAWSASNAPAVNSTAPENDTTANVANTGGGENLEDCYIAHEGDAGTSMDHRICSLTGDVVDINVDDTGNNIESYVLTMEGDLLREYTGFSYAGDGKYKIPEDSLTHESEELLEQHRNDQSTFEYNDRQARYDSGSMDSGTDSCHPRVPIYYC